VSCILDIIHVKVSMSNPSQDPCYIGSFSLLCNRIFLLMIFVSIDQVLFPRVLRAKTEHPHLLSWLVQEYLELLQHEISTMHLLRCHIIMISFLFIFIFYFHLLGVLKDFFVLFALAYFIICLGDCIGVTR